jgi:hypothetical protein
VLEFFEISGRYLLAAEAAAGVRHHVAVSIVGTDRTPETGYFRRKVFSGETDRASGIPYTIIRATEFLDSSAPSPIQLRMEAWSGSRPGAWLEAQVVRDSGGRMTPQYSRLDGEGQFLFVRLNPSRYRRCAIAICATCPAVATRVHPFRLLILGT